jgi:pimeloyl-ACP methyl ester carboxylesterase
MPVAPKLASIPLDKPFAGTELAYTEWGESAAPRTVLCVHGLTRNSRDFDALAAALAEAGARVIAVDVAGRGRSSRLADPTLYTPATYAAQLAKFCLTLNLSRVDWVGTSMGGIIGMMLAAHPATNIARLVLNDVGPYIERAALEQIASYVGLELRFDTLTDLERHLRTIHAGFGALTDEQWRHMAEHSARRDGDGWRLSYDPAIRVPYAGRAAQDVEIWALWNKIACPTFVLRGGDSRILTAATAARMAETGPRATVETLAGIGHAPALMDPRQIAIVRRWLGL